MGSGSLYCKPSRVGVQYVTHLTSNKGDSSLVGDGDNVASTRKPTPTSHNADPRQKATVNKYFRQEDRGQIAVGKEDSPRASTDGVVFMPWYTRLSIQLSSPTRTLRHGRLVESYITVLSNRRAL